MDSIQAQNLVKELGDGEYSGAFGYEGQGVVVVATVKGVRKEAKGITYVEAIENLRLASLPVDPRLQAVKGVLETLSDEGGRIFSSTMLDEISKKILFWIDEVGK